MEITSKAYLSIYGVSSTTVMLLALKELDADVDFYIPNRFTEGYGPNEAAFKYAKEQGYSLIITVDTGISAVHEAQVAKDLGLDLIITDHHEIPPVIPEAYAIIHPKVGTDYPFKELAGVGVAFKLAHGLLGRFPSHLLEIAVIGTIADLVPLHGENRLIAKLGIRQLGSTQRPGLQALIEVCGLRGKELSEESIGFGIGPRINAVGRLESAHPAVELLMTDDAEEASELAGYIEDLNKQRQGIVNEITKEAMLEVEKNPNVHSGGVLVLAKEGWNVGVIGIVASRLVDKYSKPTIVLGIDPEKGTAKGSARSIQAFDLFANLSDCRDILPHFGGHPMAAGMTLKVEDVAQLRERLNKLAEEQLCEEDFIPTVNVDIVCKVEEVTVKLIEEIQLLAPFGVGNPKPRTIIENVQVDNVRQIGGEGTHIKLTLADNGKTVDAVGFGLGHVCDHISKDASVSVLGELSVNEWNNMRKPQMMLQDIAINEWQLFDIRGNKNVKKYLDGLKKEDICLISFEGTESIAGYEDVTTFIKTGEDASSMDVSDKYVFLLDLPPATHYLEEMVKNGFPQRFYTVFLSNETHLFQTNPTRDQFKWYYGFAKKYAPFDLKQYGQKMCAHNGWSKETLLFMTKVFVELEFISLDGSIVSLNSDGKKRDLSESTSYREKQEKVSVESDLLYSSYGQLKDWFQALGAQSE